MNIASGTLLEKISNLLSPEDKKFWAEPVYNLLQKAYADIGGLKGTGFNTIEDMIQNIPFIKIYRIDTDIKGVIAYKDKQGRKIVAIGTDGSSEGRNFIKSVFRDQLMQGKAYIEASDKCIRFIEKIFTPEELKGIIIKPETAQKILPDDKIEPIDDEEYSRDIGGHMRPKKMLGKPIQQGGQTLGAPKISIK